MQILTRGKIPTFSAGFLAASAAFPAAVRPWQLFGRPSLASATVIRERRPRRCERRIIPIKYTKFYTLFGKCIKNPVLFRGVGPWRAFLAASAAAAASPAPRGESGPGPGRRVTPTNTRSNKRVCPRPQKGEAGGSREGHPDREVEDGAGLDGWRQAGGWAVLGRAWQNRRYVVPVSFQCTVDAINSLFLYILSPYGTVEQ